MQKLRLAFQRFMIGRYGNDTLNSAIVWTLFGVLLLELFIRSQILNWIYAFGFAWYVFRFLSKNRVNRNRENQRFLKLIRPFRNRFTILYRNLTDKGHRYYLCPQCNTKVRIPSGHGQVTIVCPNCRHEFTKRS